MLSSNKPRSVLFGMIQMGFRYFWALPGCDLGHSLPWLAMVMDRGTGSRLGAQRPLLPLSPTHASTLHATQYALFTSLAAVARTFCQCSYWLFVSGSDGCLFSFFALSLRFQVCCFCLKLRHGTTSETGGCRIAPIGESWRPWLMSNWIGASNNTSLKFP